MADGTIASIHPDIRAIVYCAAVSQGGDTEWEWMLQRSHTGNTISERLRALGCLSYTKKPYLLLRTLSLIFNSSAIRLQDAASVFVSVARNPLGRKIAWSFFQERYDDIGKLFGGNVLFQFSSLVNGVASYFATEWDYNVRLISSYLLLSFYQEVAKFFQSKNLTDTEMVASQVLETIKANVRYVNTNSPVLAEYLNANAY